MNTRVSLMSGGVDYLFPVLVVLCLEAVVTI